MKVSESCLRTSKSFLTKEGRRARLKGRIGQYRELRREAIRAVMRDKKVPVHGVCETVESHL